MAPRGRPKKVGLRRIDAAIDALAPLGFSRELVQKTVVDLLKVYEGDEGWVFIEEASYKILIETILNNQEEEREEEIAQSKVKNDESAAENCEADDIDSHHDSQSDTQQGGTFDCEGTSCMDGLRHGLDGQGQPSYQPSGRARQRDPCFGWLSESEEENESESEEPEDKSETEKPPSNAYNVCQDQERVFSTGSLHHEMKREPPSNASFKQEQERVGFAGSLHHKRKRRSRWDVKPSDM